MTSRTSLAIGDLEWKAEGCVYACLKASFPPFLSPRVQSAVGCIGCCAVPGITRLFFHLHPGCCERQYRYVGHAVPSTPVPFHVMVGVTSTLTTPLAFCFIIHPGFGLGSRSHPWCCSFILKPLVLTDVSRLRALTWAVWDRPDEFKELIDAVFRFDWRGSDKIVAAFTGLLTHLVSANGTCMVPAMHMLVRNLVLSPRDLNGERRPRGELIAHVV